MNVSRYPNSATANPEHNTPSSIFDGPPTPNNKPRNNSIPASHEPLPPSQPLQRTFIQSTHGPPKGRKGHSKSRNGCFTCKRVKLKCRENRPICDYCGHRGLKCEWPEAVVKKVIHKHERKVAAKSTTTATRGLPVVKASLKENLPIFTLEDFRLFNHFIQGAYPRHPANNDSVWKHEIPCLASDYDYLLHSMLALSASELAKSSECPPKMRNLALSHRVKSITALNAAIQRGVNSSEEGNAMLATCFALLFQSTLISEGLVEYMTFLRGTFVVSVQMFGNKHRFLFDQISEDERPQSLPPGTEDVPIIDRDLILGACRSFKRFEALCEVGIEKDMFEVLLDITKSLLVSSAEAYFKLRRVYRLFACTMSHDDFRYYCDPANTTCRILQAHFVALQLIMEPINRQVRERPALSKCPMKEGSRAATAGWLVSLHKDIPEGYEAYYSWTMWVEKEICGGRILDGRLGEGEGGGCPFGKGEVSEGDKGEDGRVGCPALEGGV